MINTWLLKRKLRGLIAGIKWSNFPHPKLSEFETQDYRTDFIYQLQSMNFGSGSFFLSLPDFHHGAVFGRKVFESSIIKTRLPLTSFFGSCGGKSGTYQSFAEFAAKLLALEDDNPLFPQPIKFQTDADFEDNIRTIENRFSEKAPLTAHYFPWSKKYYLANYDCSHHIAAVYRQCLTQGREYHIECELRSWQIDRRALADFDEKYLILSVAEKLADLFVDLCCKTKIYCQAARIGQTNLRAVFISRDQRGITQTFEDLIDRHSESERAVFKLNDLLTLESPR